MLVNDKKLREKMGDTGQQFVKDNFSWEKIAKKFVDDIKQVLNE
jgi:glycosyltransferase involved in cell wall biosynthesis